MQQENKKLEELLSFMKERVEIYGLYEDYLRDTEDTLNKIDNALRKISDEEKKEEIRSSL